MIDRAEFHRRFTFDFTPSFLGKPLSGHSPPYIVELHLAGGYGIYMKSVLVKLDHARQFRGIGKARDFMFS
jgi:hypothetical protein